MITTSTGKMIDPFAMKLEDLNISEIAHSLALLNRFVGHTREPYSVAQHSVMVSSLCEPRDALAGLLHDASEAYLGDVATPIKRTPQMVGYRVAEMWCMEAVVERWGLQSADWEAVRVIDEKMCATEAFQLFAAPPAWAMDRERFDIVIKPWPWMVAEMEFERVFDLLTHR